MCGICGIYNLKKDETVKEKDINDMVLSILHRGPDANSVYIDNYVGFGHVRLSVIDLAGGVQPMFNEDHTICITYNGEIYNYRELKFELEKKGHIFKSNSDTEVIIHSYEEYGYECVKKFNGMFAFAIWDKNAGSLFLARDRIGIKPLYYTISNNRFIFASEIKGILATPYIEKKANLNAVTDYILCTTLLNGKTMFDNIHGVAAGSYLVLNRDNNISMKEYWDIPINDAHQNDFLGSTKEINWLLNSSVEMRMMTDVPFGSLLSGGLDSSIVTALASNYSDVRLSTYSMEYAENSMLRVEDSDTVYARTMAELYHTNHKELVFNSDEYQNVIEKTIWHVEKPIDLTASSLYLLYSKIKGNSTVVLTGEGADELFGGYFFFLNNVSKKQNTLNEFPWAPYLDEVSLILNHNVLKKTNCKEEIHGVIQGMLNKNNTKHHMNKVLYMFVKLYLLEMLERQDKTSMAWGIEARVPFLDHRLVEYVANIPFEDKLNGNNEKYILKKSFLNVVPDQIINRKKRPLPIPVDPKSVYSQVNAANELIQKGSSRISELFNKSMTDDFFNRRGIFRRIDSLALFRTSFTILSLEKWYSTFGV